MQRKQNYLKSVNLAFDHDFLIKTALKRFVGRLNYTDDSFSLLEDKNNFELLELIKIHEAILFQKLDKANFRKMFIRDYVNKRRVKEIGKFEASGKPKTMRYKYLGNKEIDL